MSVATIHHVVDRFHHLVGYNVMRHQVLYTSAIDDNRNLRYTDLRQTDDANALLQFAYPLGLATTWLQRKYLHYEAFYDEVLAPWNYMDIGYRRDS